MNNHEGDETAVTGQSGCVLAVAAAGVTTIVLLEPSEPAPVAVSAPPHEAFIQLATETIAVPGGKWTFADEKTPFSVRRALTHKPEECLSDSSAEQYSLTLYGPAADTPSEAIEKMTRRWEALHYSVRTVADTGNATEIAAAVPDGSEIGYFASTGITSLTVQSPCVKSAS